MLKSLLPWFSVSSSLAGSRPLWPMGLGLMGLHLALIVAVTGNLDQAVLSLLFWAAIAAQVRQQGVDRLGRSPQWLGVVAIGLVGLVAWPLLGSDPAIARAVVRLFPILTWASWCLLGRRWQGQGPVWALVLAMSVPPRALPLLLETVVDLPLRVTTAAIAAFGLHYLGFEVVQTDSLIQLPTGTVNVEFACTDQIGADGQVAVVGKLPLPGHQLTAGRLQHPAIEGGNQPRFFRQGNKFVGGDKAPSRVLPAHQGFEPTDAVALDVDNRLVVDHQFFVDQGVAQVLLQLQALQGIDMHGFVEQGVLVSALTFGPVQGDIGIAENLGGGLVGGRPHYQADAGFDKDFPLTNRQRLLKRLQNPLGKVRR
nr:archaeosortase/exosortase family protein [Leptolyngbya sp. KIOST-1]